MNWGDSHIYPSNIEVERHHNNMRDTCDLCIQNFEAIGLDFIFKMNSKYYEMNSSGFDRLRTFSFQWQERNNEIKLFVYVYVCHWKRNRKRENGWEMHFSRCWRHQDLYIYHRFSRSFGAPRFCLVSYLLICTILKGVKGKLIWYWGRSLYFIVAYCT